MVLKGRQRGYIPEQLCVTVAWGLAVTRPPRPGPRARQHCLQDDAEAAHHSWSCLVWLGGPAASLPGSAGPRSTSLALGATANSFHGYCVREEPTGQWCQCLVWSKRQ